MANLTFQILELTDPIQARFNTFILKLATLDQFQSILPKLMKND